MAQRSTATRHLAIRLAAASALALVLAACKDDDTARIDAPEPAPLAELAVIDDLPAAQPAPIGDYGPARGYRLAERAYGLQQAVYDAPPDYGFYYDDEPSYVWETADDWTMYAEPWDDGYRYYYYEPGAAYPYFVRDRNYGYGYDSGGVLVVVFDAGGRYLSRDLAYRMAPTAGRYYVRGHDLWQARRAAPRVQVTERTWAAEAPRLVRTADPWLRAGREQRDWREWRARDHDRELRRFEGEQRQRQASAEVWRARLARDQGQTRAAIRADRRETQADRVQLREERRMPFERRDDQLQARAEQRREAEAGRQFAFDQRRAAEQARAVREDDRRRQAFEQGRRQQAEQARAEQAQRQQAVQAERRQQQLATREQARAQHEQQAQQAERAQAYRAEQRQQRAQAERAQAERAQQQQQAQAERQVRQQAQRAEHEARAQAQQQARQQQAQQAQHEARAQAQQQARQQQAQQGREQARAADQNGRAAAAREGKPDRPHPGKDRKD